jgi:hypothetical protein
MPLLNQKEQVQKDADRLAAKFGEANPFVIALRRQIANWPSSPQGKTKLAGQIAQAGQSKPPTTSGTPSPTGSSK